MTTLEALRDDGPLVARATRMLGRESKPGPFAWLSPPLVRALEYGGLVALTATTERGAVPACFAFLAVLAFHHYDVMYRVRSGRMPAPAWLAAVGGGWELRLVAGGLVAALGVLEVALVVAAGALGAVYVAESAISWARSGRRGALQAAGAADPEALE